MKRYLTALLLIGFSVEILWAQHIPAGHSHGSGSICWGYACGRVYGKSWNSVDCPLNNIYMEEIPSEYFDIYTPFSYQNVQEGDIVIFRNGNHVSYLDRKDGPNSTQIYLDNVDGQGAPEEDDVRLDIMSNRWDPPTGYARKKKLWEIKLQNNYTGGKIGYQYSEYSSPKDVYNLDWGNSVQVDAVDHNRTVVYKKIFQRWIDDQNNQISTNKVTWISITHNHLIQKTFTAEFLNEYNVTFENEFVGISDPGIIKVNGAQYNLPQSGFPVLEGNSIDVEALNQIINGIHYRFERWEDGSTSRYKTIFPTDEVPWVAEFEGIPLQVTGAHNTAPAGSNVHLVWDMHPNPNIRYHIFRKVKGVSGTSQIANLPRTTTSFTDYDYVVTNGYTDKLISYDVRAYYITESTYADNNWWSLFGSIAFKQAANNDSLNTTLLAFGIRNFPNPFNPSTTIEYVIPEPGAVQVRIVDVSGRIVKTLVNRYQSAGMYFIMWDGTNEYGEKAVSGFYFLQLVGNGQTAIRKILLMK